MGFVSMWTVYRLQVTKSERLSNGPIDPGDRSLRSWLLSGGLREVGVPSRFERCETLAGVLADQVRPDPLALEFES